MSTVRKATGGEATQQQLSRRGDATTLACGGGGAATDASGAQWRSKPTNIATTKTQHQASTMVMGIAPPRAATQQQLPRRGDATTLACGGDGAATDACGAQWRSKLIMQLPPRALVRRWLVWLYSCRAPRILHYKFLFSLHVEFFFPSVVLLLLKHAAHFGETLPNSIETWILFLEYCFWNLLKLVFETWAKPLDSYETVWNRFLLFPSLLKPSNQRKHIETCIFET